MIHDLLSGRKEYEVSELAYIRDQIDYRINQAMVTVTLYKDYLGISTVDCQKFDYNVFRGRSNLNIMERYVMALLLVRSYPLFDKPVGSQGHQYVKGDNYLAACFAETNWSKEL